MHGVGLKSPLCTLALHGACCIIIHISWLTSVRNASLSPLPLKNRAPVKWHPHCLDMHQAIFQLFFCQFSMLWVTHCMVSISPNKENQSRFIPPKFGSYTTEVQLVTDTKLSMHEVKNTKVYNHIWLSEHFFCA